jgi:hypothetical protein
MITVAKTLRNSKPEKLKQLLFSSIVVLKVLVLSHIDDKYGIDVDETESMIRYTIQGKYAIKIKLGSSVVKKTLHIGMCAQKTISV